MAGRIKSFILGFLYKLRKLIISFVVLVILLFFYNAFLVDHAIDNLKFSLEQTVLAYNISDLGGLDIVLNQAALEETASLESNSKTMMNLDNAKRIASSGKTYLQIDHMKVSLESIIKDKEKKRGPVLTILDNLSRTVNKALIYCGNSLKQVFQKETFGDAIQEAADLLETGLDLEKEGKIEKAVATYDEIIKKFPSYSRLPLVKLRLGYALQNSGKYDRAALVYRELIRKYFMKREADIAQILLTQLNKRSAMQKKANELLVKAFELPDTMSEEKQKLLYQVGALNLRTNNLNDAKKFFNRAASVDSKTDLGKKAKFNTAWINKEQNNLDASLANFEDLIGVDPSSSLAADSRYEVASIKLKQGKYEEAIEMLLKLAEYYKDDPAAALCLFQAGASYMYDLNNTEKANVVFELIQKKYPKSEYAKYLAPDNPIGIFITYLVPRATQVVTWRSVGLLSLVGYSGELVKMKVTFPEEMFNVSFNKWLKEEVPDTVGNMYVDIRGAEIKFEDNKASGGGTITMGKFKVKGAAAGRAVILKDGKVDPVLTKVILAGIPILPALINNAVRNVCYIANNNFAAIPTRISIKNKEAFIEGYASKRMARTVKKTNVKFVGMEINIKELEPAEKEEVYQFFKTKFPESNFSPKPQYGDEELFMDFLTRMNLYMSYKLLETVKDSKLDYRRSIRALGELMVKTDRFGISYSEEMLNNLLQKFIKDEFPWLLDKEFMFGVKEIKVKLIGGRKIDFESILELGHNEVKRDGISEEQYYATPPVIEGKEIKVKGRLHIETNKVNFIPRIVFEEMTLNGKPVSLDRANLVTLRAQNILIDGHLPFKVYGLMTDNKRLIIKGEGARDFTSRIFGDPYPLVIFVVREWDRRICGIEKLDKEHTVDFFRADGASDKGTVFSNN